ncbi:MAG: GNAT family N-acetyltransferase [Anaerolineae bacterium]|jgi:GNAT superfamily N-acetyltransferase
MEAKYVIRAALPADLATVADLVHKLQDHLEASNPDLWRMTDEARANLKGQLAGRLRDPQVCALVAEHEREGIIGVIFGRIVTNKRYVPARAGQIDQAFVHENHRLQGIGSQLVAQLTRYFAQQGVEDISLRYVSGNQQAEAFWTALGFSPRIITAGAGRKRVTPELNE